MLCRGQCAALVATSMRAMGDAEVMLTFIDTSLPVKIELAWRRDMTCCTLHCYEYEHYHKLWAVSRYHPSRLSRPDSYLECYVVGGRPEAAFKKNASCRDLSALHHYSQTND